LQEDYKKTRPHTYLVELWWAHSREWTRAYTDHSYNTTNKQKTRWEWTRAYTDHSYYTTNNQQ